MGLKFKATLLPRWFLQEIKVTTVLILLMLLILGGAEFQLVGWFLFFKFCESRQFNIGDIIHKVWFAILSYNLIKESSINMKSRKFSFISLGWSYFHLLEIALHFHKISRIYFWWEILTNILSIYCTFWEKKTPFEKK